MNTQSPNTYYEPSKYQPSGKSKFTASGWIKVYDVEKESKGCSPVIINLATLALLSVLVVAGLFYIL